MLLWCNATIMQTISIDLEILKYFRLQDIHTYINLLPAHISASAFM